MKTLKFRTLSTTVMVVILLVAAQFTKAQTTELVWEKYKLSFKMLSDCDVDKNNAEEFSVNCTGLSISIFPWNDEEVTIDDIADATVSIAKELKYDEITDADELQLNDFEGVYVEGVKDGVNAVIIGLIDPEGEANFYVIIVYKDDYLDDAINVAKSIKKM